MEQSKRFSSLFSLPPPYHVHQAAQSAAPGGHVNLSVLQTGCLLLSPNQHPPVCMRIGAGLQHGVVVKEALVLASCSPDSRLAKTQIFSQRKP